MGKIFLKSVPAVAKVSKKYRPLGRFSQRLSRNCSVCYTTVLQYL